ncbi:MAG: chorismate synthase [Clostridiaceae bacterium]
MSGMWGNKLKVSIFGESHGKAIGITIDGLPSGVKLDEEEIQKEMKRRAPGQNPWSTPRKEEDKVEFLSGFFKGVTTGTPICGIIQNTNTISKDYSNIKTQMRPSHGDFSGFVKYDGFNDHRGGGHFSARVTAGLVFAGAVAKQILKQKGITIGAHIKSVRNVQDESFDKLNVTEELLKRLHNSNFPTINEEVAEKMQGEIIAAKDDNDSVGGTVEVAVINLPVGVGAPYFDSVESTLAHLVFSVPATKGIEFGAGFGISELKGSEANDEMYIENGVVKNYSNNNGGITGGLTNGMPLVFRVALKPTSSIGKPQRTVDVTTMENTIIEVKGRHDPCIVQRAVPVLEAVTAIGILDLVLGG